jgi:nucleoside-diphosphate-sugar epimerase
MAILLVGKHGRFARAFQELITNQYELVCFSFQDIQEQSFDALKSAVRSKLTHVIWSVGAGNSRNAEGSVELATLHLFRDKILKHSNDKPKFFYLSSGGTVYGRSPGLVDELSNTNPESLHGKQKIGCEIFVKEEFQEYFHSIFILRIANAYSLHASRNFQGLIEALMHSSIFGKDVTISVSPDSKRQYGRHIDYARFILDSLLDLDIGSQAIQTFNVANTEVLSIREIIEIFNDVFPNRIRVQWEYGSEETVILDSKFPPNVNYPWKSLKCSLQDFKAEFQDLLT